MFVYLMPPFNTHILLYSVLDKEQEVNEELRARSMGRSSISFDHYFRYDEITQFLHGLVAEFPSLITVETAGQSYQGRELWAAKISTSNFDGTKPVILIDAGIHAREWIAPMSILFLIHELVEHSADHPEMLNVDWYIIPMANPDGYENSHVSDRMWRKTMSTNNGSACLGTDPNRNFDFQWQVGTSTSDNPCAITYRGPNPNSEVEVRIISNLMHTVNPKCYLAIHSFGDFLLYPYGYQLYIDNPHTDNLQILGTRVSNAIRARYPHRSYKVGNSAHELYPASGASDDYASGGAGIAYSYTVELTSGGSTGFDPPPSSIQQISSEIFVGYREYAIATAEM